MNMTDTPIELNETTAGFAATQATALPLQAETTVQSEIAAPVRRKSWKSRPAAWLLPPLSVCAVYLLVKAALVAGEVFSILNIVYANGLN